MLQPAVVAERRVGLLQPLVNRRRAQGPRGGQLLVGEADTEAARIIFAHFGIGPGHGCPIAVARHIHAPDVRARITVHHPVRQGEANAAALAETGHDAAGNPEISEAAYRTNKRISIWRKSEWPVDDLLDPGLADVGKMLEPHSEAGSDALQIIGQQILSEIPRRFTL